MEELQQPPGRLLQPLQQVRERESSDGHLHWAILDRNYTVFASLDYGDVDLAHHTTNLTLPCHSWQFDSSWFSNTLAQKFNLVCGDNILTKVGSTTFFAGTGVGVFIAGILADKIGRKKTLIIFCLLFFASGLGSAFASSYEVWLVTRFLWGAASLGLRAVKTVMSLELVGSKWRAIICVGLIEGGWTLGKYRSQLSTKLYI